MNIPEGYEILPCMYVSDISIVKRTWKERLFSLPWKPFQKTKEIEEPKVYLSETIAVVSYKTYYRLMKEKESK